MRLPPPEWIRKRLEEGGLSPRGARRAARHMARAGADLARLDGVDRDAPLSAYFVPGRIELVGKHVDYAGGRSLVTAVEQGFSIVAAPASELRFVSSNAAGSHGWERYADAVVRRFPPPGATEAGPAGGGVAVAFSSSLPSAAGLSSSSALVVALHLALAARYGIDELGQGGAVGNDAARLALAARLASVERGDAHDPGVGTEGGSQDHAAVLGARAGMVTRLGYRPLRLEGRAPFPAGWTLVVGVSGVRAAKAAGARGAYNRLSREAADAAARWPGPEGSLPHLGAALPLEAPSFSDATLGARVEQFRVECTEVVPGVFDLLNEGTLEATGVEALGRLVGRSQAMAESVLRNQVPETVALVRLAREYGAAAASAFGAGFGGAVWALVEEQEASRFLGAWRQTYLERFPFRKPGSRFFSALPGPGAFQVL